MVFHIAKFKYVILITEIFFIDIGDQGKATFSRPWSYPKKFIQSLIPGKSHGKHKSTGYTSISSLRNGVCMSTRLVLNSALLTDKAGIKYCEDCNTEVHLCLNQDELNKATKQGLCIAYFPNPSRPLQFNLSREKAEAKKRDPDFEPIVLLGIPRGYSHSPALKAFLEDEEDDEI